MKREFPFQTKIGGRVVTVTGLHWSGGCYTTEGHGLIPLSVKAVESPEPAAVYAPVASSPKDGSARTAFGANR